MRSSVSRMACARAGVIAVVLAGTLAVAPIARAQLLGRASSAVRGESGGGSRSSGGGSRDDERSSSDRASDAVRGGGGSRRGSGSSSGGRSSVLDRASRAVREEPERARGWGTVRVERADPAPSYERDAGPRRRPRRERARVSWEVAPAGGASYVEPAPTSGGGIAVSSARERSAVPYTGDETSEAAGGEPTVYGRVEVEGGYVLAGAGRGGLGGRVELPVPLDLAARYSLFVEPLDAGIQAVALGRVGLAWRAIDIPEIVVRLGLGVRHFQDGEGAVGGVDAVLGVDLFPGDPIVLSLEVGGGFVGEAIVAQARASLGVVVEGYEIYAGYDYEGLFAGTGSVDLGGPMLGLRVWI